MNEQEFLAETQAPKNALEAYFTALPDDTIKTFRIKTFRESDMPEIAQGTDVQGPPIGPLFKWFFDHRRL